VFTEAPPERPARIAVVPAAGGASQPVTGWSSLTTQPAWAPDGLSIAFASPGPEGDNRDWWTIWTVSRDRVGSAWQPPVPLTDFDCYSPKWHPGGDRLACLSVGRGELDFKTIVTVSREGRELSRFSTGMPLYGSDAYDFSTDGSRIYLAGTTAEGVQGAWWIAAEGGTWTQVVAFDDPTRTVVQGMTVGPEHLYFTIAEYESDIYVADLEYR